MKWSQEALDSFLGNVYLGDREIHYNPAVMKALEAVGKRSAMLEGDPDYNYKGPKDIKREKIEVIRPTDIHAVLYDVDIIKFLFQNFVAKKEIGAKYVVENIAVCPLPGKDKGVLYLASDTYKLAIYHSEKSTASHYLLLNLPTDFLKSIKPVQAAWMMTPLTINNGMVSVMENAGVTSQLSLDRVYGSYGNFVNAPLILPRKIKVQELMGGHAPVMYVNQLAAFMMKTKSGDNTLRIIFSGKMAPILVFTDFGLWGVIMGSNEEKFGQPSVIREVWPGYNMPADPWAVVEEKAEEAAKDGAEEEKGGGEKKPKEAA